MARRRRRSRKNKQIKIIMAMSICLILIMTVGYAAFKTQIGVKVKGNVKNLKAEVDSKVPTNELLFWGQADNEENTLNVLKDKSGNNNDGAMNGFDNTNVSGYNNDELVFDGVNDYVDIGLANYDFKNSISLVTYIKINLLIDNDKYSSCIFGNWEGGGNGFYVFNNMYKFELFDMTKNLYVVTNGMTVTINEYNTVIASYDGQNVKMYIDGKLIQTNTVNNMKNSPMPMVFGANPGTEFIHFSNMSLKEAMLYDRALTEDEVKTITEGFERKYK